MGHDSSESNDRWTLYLLLCALTAAISSFIFGYNIGVTNLPTQLIKTFYGNRFCTNNETTEFPDACKNLTDMLWVVTNVLFVVGGMIGAISSKSVMDKFGRKKSILYHYALVLIAGALNVLAPHVDLPEFVMAARFLYGVHGGMTCCLIPTYLAEISPVKLRGRTGLMQQINVVVGILVSQLLGFREVLGTATRWHFLLALPLVFALKGFFLLLLFFPETPSALLGRNKDRDSAKTALQRLRNRTDVEDELDEIERESSESSNKNDSGVGILTLFKKPQFRWPILTALTLQVAQQLSGINAVFFYSESMFLAAGIKPAAIQYAVAATGIINTLATFIALPLIDRLGRKPLLVVPMIGIILDFIGLTIIFSMSNKTEFISYLSILCIIVYILFFAVGLGPIPFLYVAEVFNQEARSTAYAVCMLTNWTANTACALAFPILEKMITPYTFVPFAIVVLFCVVIIIVKMPETKGRSYNEVLALFAGRKAAHDTTRDEAGSKLLAKSSV